MMSKRMSPWLCVLINQAAFPGLGTKLAGRRVGYLQMAVMLAGFCFVVGFMLWPLFCVVRDLQNATPADDLWRFYRQAAWAGWWGLGLSATAWCWAGVSSISILRSRTDRPPSLHDGRRA